MSLAAVLLMIMSIYRNVKAVLWTEGITQRWKVGVRIIYESIKFNVTTEFQTTGVQYTRVHYSRSFVVFDPVSLSVVDIPGYMVVALHAWLVDETFVVFCIVVWSVFLVCCHRKLGLSICYEMSVFLCTVVHLLQAISASNSLVQTFADGSSLEAVLCHQLAHSMRAVIYVSLTMYNIF